MRQLAIILIWLNIFMMLGLVTYALINDIPMSWLWDAASDTMSAWNGSLQEWFSSSSS